jgi:hypothetical protein
MLKDRGGGCEDALGSCATVKERSMGKDQECSLDMGLGGFIPELTTGDIHFQPSPR